MMYISLRMDSPYVVITFKRKGGNIMAMEGGGMIDFIMDIIRDTVESARAETSERACRARQQQHQQQKSNPTSSSHKNQGR